MEPSPPFVPGLELSKRFYREAVRPIIDRDFPYLVHSAALIGYGSEVLRYDTPRSTDHRWGPRVRLFLRPEDFDQFSQALTDVLSGRLPRTFLGYPTHFENSFQLAATEHGPIQHHVE